MALAASEVDHEAGHLEAGLVDVEEDWLEVPFQASNQVCLDFAARHSPVEMSSFDCQLQHKHYCRFVRRLMSSTSQTQD